MKDIDSFCYEIGRLKEKVFEPRKGAACLMQALSPALRSVPGW